MRAEPGSWRRTLGRVSAWFARQAQPVPTLLRVCEFACDEWECPPDRWASCQRRLDLQRSPLADPPARARA